MPSEYLRFLQRGYSASISFLDAQVGRVLNTLHALGHWDTTMVVFFADHGFNLGGQSNCFRTRVALLPSDSVSVDVCYLDHGQLGKRSLFETDARVPLVIRDPNNPKSHGHHTRSFVELVDLFPTTAVLAGLPFPELTPPLEGDTFDQLFETPHRILKSEAITQGMRCCPIKEWPHISWTSRISAPTDLQCKRKGTTWEQQQRDLGGFGPLMGYSLRTPEWRYTAWFLWNSTKLQPNWEAVEAEELYDHRSEAGLSAPADFDAVEGANLLPESGRQQEAFVVDEKANQAREIASQLRARLISRVTRWYPTRDIVVCNGDIDPGRDRCKRR